MSKKSKREKIERKKLKSYHFGSHWVNGILINKYGQPVPKVPTGEELRKKFAYDYNKGYELKSNPRRGRSKRKRRQRRLSPFSLRL